MLWFGGTLEGGESQVQPEARHGNKTIESYPLQATECRKKSMAYPPAFESLPLVGGFLGGQGDCVPRLLLGITGVVKRL